MKIRLEGSGNLLYKFDSIEEVIALAKRLQPLGVSGGSLYAWENQYYLLMNDLEHTEIEKTASLLSEYGNTTIQSPYVLAEYGNLVIRDNTIEALCHYFR